jgi:hypothetical protein
MTDEDRPSSGTPGVRRRPATVIDLQATEVPSDAATPELKVEMPPLEPPRDPPPKADEKSASEQPSAPPPPKGSSWALLSAGFAGAAGALLVVVVFWLAGALPTGREPSTDLSPRLAKLEKQLSDLAARPAPAAADTKALDDISARLTRLESAQATPRPPLTDPVVLGRLTATENAVKSAADNMVGLSRRADAIDASQRDTNSRIDKLTASLADVLSTARQAAAGSDRASRFAVAASALRGAVERGDPFTGELAIVKPLTSDADAVALLEPFAANGVPTNAALGRELAAIVHAMPRAEAQPSSGGSFIDRLSANAEKLVRIRPVGAGRGDDRDAVLSRVEQRAAQGDVGGATVELTKLPAEARAPAQAWLAKAEARNKAIAASRKLAADAVAALKAAP